MARSIQEIVAERNTLVDQCNRLIEESNQLQERTDRGGHLTEGEQERYTNLQTGIARKNTRIDELREEERAALLDAVQRGGLGTEGGSQPDAWAARGITAGTGAAGNTTVRDSGPFASERREALGVLRSARHLGDQLRDTVARMVEADERSPLTALWAAAASDPAYARAFGKLCRDPLNGHRSFTTEELDAYQRAEYTLRALNLSTGAAMLPTHLDASILLSSDGSTDPFRQIARVEQGVHQVFNAVSSAGVTTSWTAEAAEVGDNSPAFATPTATAFKATSFVPISFEALGDMALDGMGGAPVGHTGSTELDRLFSDERRNHEAAAFTTGNGTTAPRGLVTALDANTNSEVANLTSNTFASGDVYNLVEQLPPRFRANASWMANLSIINTADQFETANGAKLFPGLADTEPTLLRRRIYENSEMDGTIAPAATDNILTVGDFRHYLIYDRVPSQLELVPHLFGSTNGRPTGQRGFLYWWRVGGNCLIDNAFRMLQARTNP